MTFGLRYPASAMVVAERLTPVSRATSPCDSPFPRLTSFSLAIGVRELVCGGEFQEGPILRQTICLSTLDSDHTPTSHLMADELLKTPRTVSPAASATVPRSGKKTDVLLGYDGSPNRLIRQENPSTPLVC
jgi:hypothetical protein